MQENIKGKLKVVVLIGPSLANKNTVTTLINKGVNVVGVVAMDHKNNGINVGFLKRSIKNFGIMKVFGQILERILYKLINNKKDIDFTRSFFKQEETNSLFNSFSSDFIINTNSYSNSETLTWIKNKNPDLIVIHTPYWIGKKVRDLVNGNIIGGHPGLTQHYRGVHSPFWAIYNNDLNTIGYTVFWVDGGVDTGNIIKQGMINVEKGDSYRIISYKGMRLIYQTIAEVLSNSCKIEDIPRVPNQVINKETLYYHPTIFQYLKYLIKQNKYS